MSSVEPVNFVTYLWPHKWEYVASRKYQTSGVQYTQEYVDKLHRAIARNTTYPYEIHHFTEKNFMDPFPGWFQLFSFMQLPFPFIFIGLDSVVCGSMDDVADYGREKGRLVMNRDVIYSSKLPNSNLMWVQDCMYLYKKFKELYGDGSTFSNTSNDYNGQTVKTDEHFIEEYGEYDFFPAEWRVSYKIDLKNNKNKLPKDLKIINFHGYPKPHQVDDRRILEHWK